VVSIGVGWIRFRRFGNLHLYSARVAAIVLYVFIVGALLVPDRMDWLIVPAGLLGILTETEAILVLLSRREVDEHVGSILRPRGPRS